jgi:hypothetical protein
VNLINNAIVVRNVRLLAVVIAVALAVIGAAGSGAVMTLPAAIASGSATDADDLTGPVLPIVRTNSGWVVPAAIEEGRYLVRLENLTDYPAVADVMLLPSHTTITEVQAISAAGMMSEIQAWFDSIVMAGAAKAPPHGQGWAVVDLTPGEWTVATFGAGSYSPSTSILVTAAERKSSGISFEVAAR